MPLPNLEADELVEIQKTMTVLEGNNKFGDFLNEHNKHRSVFKKLIDFLKNKKSYPVDKMCKELKKMQSQIKSMFDELVVYALKKENIKNIEKINLTEKRLMHVKLMDTLLERLYDVFYDLYRITPRITPSSTLPIMLNRNF